MAQKRDDLTDAKTTLVATFRDACGDALRDVWVFDQRRHEPLYLRDDVRAKLTDLDVDRFIDNERYGYVTRDTYDQLYYATYEYTVRGFDRFELFRTFLTDEGGRRVGTFASLDHGTGCGDYHDLYHRVTDLTASFSAEAFLPE